MTISDTSGGIVVGLIIRCRLVILPRLLVILQWLKGNRSAGEAGIRALLGVLLAVDIRADLFGWENIDTPLDRRTILVFELCKRIVVYI